MRPSHGSLITVVPIFTTTIVVGSARGQTATSSVVTSPIAVTAKLGQGITQGDDFIVIEPRPVRPALVHCYSDHRIAMCFTVLGMATGGVRIEDPACVAKTYPGFWDDVRNAYVSASQAAPW